MSEKEGISSLMPKDGASTEKIPARLEPLMLAHYAITGDAAQHQQWRDKIERIRQSEAVDLAPDPESRAILANRAAWDQMRETGKLGALFGLGLGSLWMAWLIPLYALYYGFGWLAGLSFLLPVPLAWRVGRRLWERASLAGMRELGRRPSWRKKLRTLGRSVFRSFGAGFGFGFTLVFFQALITWFMTPAPTFALELAIDAYHAIWAGTVSGSMAMMLGPLIGRTAPSLEASSSTLHGIRGLLEDELDPA